MKISNYIIINLTCICKKKLFSLEPLPRKRGEQWTEDALNAAIRAVQRGQLGQRAAASKYNIPRRTLRNHLDASEIVVKRFGRKPILTTAQEQDLCVKIMEFAKMGIPLTPKFVRKQAFIFCDRNDIKHNFNIINKIAGPDWLKHFLKRNPSISGLIP